MSKTPRTDVVNQYDFDGQRMRKCADGAYVLKDDMVTLELEFNQLRAQLAEQRNKVLEEAADVAYTEPNLPGEIPDFFFVELKTKESATSAIRIIVGVTIANIKSRILALRTTQPANERTENEPER